MICTVVCLKVVEWQKIVNSQQLSASSFPQLSQLWSWHRMPLPPTREACTSVKVDLKQLMLDSFFGSLFLGQFCSLAFSAAQIILSSPIMDVCVIIGYCWLIVKLKTPMSYVTPVWGSPKEKNQQHASSRLRPTGIWHLRCSKQQEKKTECTVQGALWTPLQFQAGSGTVHWLAQLLLHIIASKLSSARTRLKNPTKTPVIRDMRLKQELCRT